MHIVSGCVTGSCGFIGKNPAVVCYSMGKRFKIKHWSRLKTKPDKTFKRCVDIVPGIVLGRVVPSVLPHTAGTVSLRKQYPGLVLRYFRGHRVVRPSVSLSDQPQPFDCSVDIYFVVVYVIHAFLLICTGRLGIANFSRLSAR